MTDDVQIEKLLFNKGVKLHIFMPSWRKIWTVVGKNEEYWVDPENKYCSCPAFFFAENNICYHLKLIPLALDSFNTDIIWGDDDECILVLNGIMKSIE